MSDENYVPKGKYQERRNREANYALEILGDKNFIVMDFYICTAFNERVFTQEQIKNWMGEHNGTILRSGIQNNWQKWDASTLPVETKIYDVNNNYKGHRFIADINNKLILYQEHWDIEKETTFIDCYAKGPYPAL